MTSRSRPACCARTLRNSFATRSATSADTFSTLTIFGVIPGIQCVWKNGNASLYLGRSSTAIIRGEALGHLDADG